MMTRLFFLRAAVAAAVLLVWLSAGAGVGAQETPRDPSTTADAPGTPSGATLPDGLGTFLDGYAAAHLADRYPPALMVAVATADETLIRVYGTADAATGAPATPDTLFRIASISKTFVWTAVMILADEGKLDLDADVNTLQSAVTIPEAFGAPVTLNDIMAHRGGFEDTFGVFVGADSGLTAGALLDRARPERVAPPGERTAYSNWATTLAAVIVETAAGQPFEDFVAERLLAPLAMTSTALRDPQSAPERALNDLALDARTAAPHVQEAGAASAVVHDRLEPVFAAGAASLSARDAAKWMQFFLRRGRAPDGAPILSTKTFETMRTRQFNDRPDAPDFAHGFMEAEIAGLPTYGHAGTLSGFIAEMRIVPDLGIGVFVAVNGAERIRLPDLVARAGIEFAARAPQYPAPGPRPHHTAARPP
ncbi:MAG: serine hydrolase domain-containing protein, partial [Pseudomonadota bacterium]